MRSEFRFAITFGLALVLAMGAMLFASPVQYASAASGVPVVSEHDEGGEGPHDIAGGSDPRLMGGVLHQFPYGNVTEWGYWNAEYGYTVLGWSAEAEPGVLHLDVPEDGPITVSQFREVVLTVVPESVTVVGVSEDARKDADKEHAMEATDEESAGVSDPRLTGGVLRSFVYGLVTEWGYWNAEYGYTVLGWSFADENGVVHFDTPEDGPVTARQLQEMVEMAS